MQIVDFPLEILVHIFQYLDPQDVLNASLVCKKFEAACTDDTVWKIMFFSQFPQFRAQHEWKFKALPANNSVRACDWKVHYAQVWQYQRVDDPQAERAMRLVRRHVIRKKIPANHYAPLRVVIAGPPCPVKQMYRMLFGDQGIFMLAHVTQCTTDAASMDPEAAPPMALPNQYGAQEFKFCMATKTMRLFTVTVCNASYISQSYARHCLKGADAVLMVCSERGHFEELESQHIPFIRQTLLDVPIFLALTGDSVPLIAAKPLTIQYNLTVAECEYLWEILDEIINSFVPCTD